MATFDDVRRLATQLPEVEEATSYNDMPSLKVRGKSFCRVWAEKELQRNGVEGTEVIVLFCDIEEKDVLVETSDGVLFTTPHYDGYPAFLVRLADVDLGFLAELVEDSYRAKAPRRLVKQLDQGTG